MVTTRGHYGTLNFICTEIERERGCKQEEVRVCGVPDHMKCLGNLFSSVRRW